MNRISKKHQRLLLIVTCLVVICVIYFFTHTSRALYQGYVEGENLYVSCPFEGKLVKQQVLRGEQVHKEQVLFEIDPNPEIIALKQLSEARKEVNFVESDMEKPRRPLEIKALSDQVAIVDANLTLANIRLKRFNELYQKQAIDLDHVDEAKSYVKQLEATKAQAIANLEISRLGVREDLIKAQQSKKFQATFALKVGEWKLSQKILTAPVDGILFDTYFQQGEFVPAGRPVATILPYDKVRIEFFVPARALPSLSLNQTVYFTCEGCRDKKNIAVINYISPEAEYIPPLVYSRENSDKIVFRIKAKISEPLLFKPGQPVEIVGFENAK